MFHGRSVVLSTFILVSLSSLCFLKPAHGAIYQWEWIDPSDPSQGKKQSTTLCPDGASVNAVPNAQLASKNLTQAYLIGADLRSANCLFGILTNADFSQADLTQASFQLATLANASFTDAIVHKVSFSETTSKGFNYVQLYSTASYKLNNLSGINLAGDNLSGWSFANQNLTNVDFSYSTLTGTNLTDAVVQGANFYVTTYGGFSSSQLYSTASYKNKNLSQIVLDRNNLSGWNFSNQDLSGASFYWSTLTDANFTDAVIQGSDYSDVTSSGFTAEQIYTTASYKNKNLAGVKLTGNTLTGWNFTNHNLTGASFAYSLLKNVNFAQANLSYVSFYSTNLSNVDFSQSNLTNTNFGWDSSWMTGNISGADTRGAISLYYTYGLNTTNTIRNNGSILGLNLSGNQILKVRDYDGDLGNINYDYDKNPFYKSPFYNLPHGPIPITVQNSMNMGTNGILEMIFEENAWDSKISFQSGIPVTLGGTLGLTFADGVDISAQVGRTISLFDWSGVTPTGTFNIESNYIWDVSDLYTSGNVTLLAVPEPTIIVLMTMGFLSLLCFRFCSSKRE